MGIEQEAESAANGIKAFQNIGATPCGESPPPTPSTPAPTPAPVTPSPTPQPTPSSSGCPGGTITTCLSLCPGDDAGFKACAAECDRRCGKSIIVRAEIAPQVSVYVNFSFLLFHCMCFSQHPNTLLS